MNPSRTGRFTALLAVLTLVFSTMVVDYAEARRGGSFGSRGGRTYQSAPATNTAPSVAPVQRSMTTPGQATGAAAAARPAAGQRSGLFGGGFGGAMMRGLLIGGLFGLLMGSGFGGLAGMLGLLVQVALIGLLVMLALRFFRSRSGQTAAAGGPNPASGNRSMYEGRDPNNGRSPASGGLGGMGGLGSRSAASTKPGKGGDEIGISEQDLNIFESRLKALQAAYSREDYEALREIATPEIVSYLSEELAQNASRGVRNEARDVELLQGDVAESWREGTRDYATVAMRYGMIDVVRDRQSGRVVEGDESKRVESTEIWTFVRERGTEWKLSAIQEA
ncbi:Tim44 domain-containing protein [Aureimonas sp. AU40]|uniref:Tim44 domain-containing protein n=1 Tax=Aureimonas sp. AU40 TaxID=1637747 RepID=UPI000783DE1B|nr:Tim44 domain-containing protein [Aureimonas sp. AU40]